jgi:hypothetical protein
MSNSIEAATTNVQDNNIRMQSTEATTSDNNNVTGTTKKKAALVDDECDSIGDLIGHYGKWQFVMTILLSLFQVPNTFHIFSPTFQVSF